MKDKNVRIKIIICHEFIAKKGNIQYIKINFDPQMAKVMDTGYTVYFFSPIQLLVRNMTGL